MPLRAISHAHTGLAVVVFFMLFAGEGVCNVLGGSIFGAIALALGVTYAVLLWRARARISWRRLPLTLIGFVLLAVASIAWSATPGETALTALTLILTTLGGLGIALLLPWKDLVRALGTTLRWILALSFAFEIYVSAFWGRPLSTLAVDQGDAAATGVTLWSRNMLFDGGPIQGIVGNHNQLGFLALIALVVFSVQLVDGTVWRIWGIAWLAIAIGTLALTRSSTVLLSTVAVVLVLGFVLWARVIGPGARRGLYGVAALVLLGVLAWGVFGPRILIDTLGASSDVIGSLTILNTPNPWLDIWGQLGIVGLIVFAFFVLSTTWRAWFVAVDRPRWDLTDHRPFAARSLLPLLIITALLAQSLTESQLLVQSGWALLVICAVMMKTPARIHGARQ